MTKKSKKIEEIKNLKSKLENAIKIEDRQLMEEGVKNLNIKADFIVKVYKLLIEVIDLI